MSEHLVLMKGDQLGWGGVVLEKTAVQGRAWQTPRETPGEWIWWKELLMGVGGRAVPAAWGRAATVERA